MVGAGNKVENELQVDLNSLLDAQRRLQATAQRLLPLTLGWDGLWVVTSTMLAPGVQQQLPELPEQNLLAEPEGRDTAPAVAWTTIEIAQRYGNDTIIGFFPADHWVGQPEVFHQTLNAATELAKIRDVIVTLGVKPGYPATGYGYIEQGDEVAAVDGVRAYRVARFTEKPDLETAQQFLETGRFSWNGGIFVFRAGVMLQELRTHVPELVTVLEQQGANAYHQLDKISIDYAVMEKTHKACVIPVDFDWDDLGDWNALERLAREQKTNLELAQHVGLDTQRAILYSNNPEDLIVTIGVEDLLVVREGNVTLIARKDRTQDIKKLLKQLAEDPKLKELL
ncbi:MAG: mannose-1-phosphate guanylyltransferase [Oscillatoriales cyanobacterium RM1_1_9]|nr:mannose-1-phosphate guanylyltransferase [Oscillatoriales cyanobacterium RM1_1_9]